MFAVTSCKKYEDGPLLSLRSREARVANVWKVETVLKNGNDVTGDYDNYEEIYEKGGKYSYTWTFGGVSGTGTGKWKFQNDDEEIRLYDVDAREDRILYILKLKENHFWYFYNDGGDKYEVRLTSKAS
ncbi:MAG TPA: hypothetical protein VL947_01145 [Cytophagales bacterium]|nr:hypothetical protein [Cytophagales bacterium]